MKIAMVGQFPPHFGGVGVHIHTLSKELIRQGHEVYVITYPHSDLKNIDGIHVIGTSGLNIPGIRGLMFKRNARKALENLVKEVDIDIIHGHYLFPAGAAACEVGSKYNIKTYVTAHGSDMFEMYKKQSFMRPFIKKVLKKSDVVFAVSNALKQEILSTNVSGIEAKTRLYWNSVDINKFSKDNKNLLENHGKPIVLFVGNIIKRKNVNLILEAKKQSNVDYEVVIVGDGPLLNDLKNKVEKENIPDVRFLGSRNDVENIIPGCDMLVLPSLIQMLRSQICSICARAWLTMTIVVPLPLISRSFRKHFAWKAASPTARISSISSTSASTLMATAKASRIYIPLE